MASKERRAQDKARQTAAYYRAGEAVSDELAEAYLRAYRSLQAEAERVFRTFSGVFGLSEAQARGLLKEYPNASARELLRRAAEAMTDGPEKTRALAEISAPAYQYRINRLETLQAHVERRLKEVARQELKLAKAHYTRVIGDSYLYGVYEVQRAAGVGFHFHDLSDRAVSAMVNARWPQLGITYSEAVWKDTAAIARRIREDVLAGAMTGLPARRSVERIEEDFRVRAYEARRLVRTETARMAAEADKASMEACGIEEYEFCATLDEAACSRCGALDGKRFPAEQGEPGVNMEPLHPNCGCYTVPVVEEFGGRAGTRLARDPESGKNIKIPGDMTFEAWKAGLQDDGDGGRIFTKRNQADLPSPMDETRYNRIKKTAAKRGIEIREATGEELGLLDWLGAEATIIETSMILHRQKVPSASALFEELIHLTQTKQYYRKNGYFPGTEQKVLFEVEAQKKLLKHAKAYGFNGKDIDDIQRNLKQWESEL